MATSYYPQENDWLDEDWFDDEDYYDDGTTRGPMPFDVIVLAAVSLIVMGLIAGLSRVNVHRPLATGAPRLQQEQTAEQKQPDPIAPPLPAPGADTFVMPYTEYILTQGPHGMSYGHYAIDLAAGKGEPVLSPINGRVASFYIDGIGNPVLVIENELYEVTMLHGIFRVDVGQEVQAGEQVGVESNQGNTRDMNGRSCRGRDCGYHTHLNVYDKQAGKNVNPLDLIAKAY